jgi:hypothetical protein
LVLNFTLLYQKRIRLKPECGKNTNESWYDFKIEENIILVQKFREAS